VLRPEGFDLADAWRSITADVEERRAPVRARALVIPDTLPVLRWVLGRRVRIGPAGPDGRVEVEVRSASARSLAGELAGFGAGVEVLEPGDVRDLLAGIAAELTGLYPSPVTAPPPS
jgi:predicted DNA-binding transcriptional regulator YafY